MAEARVERRLAAILAADIAGHSRLMGADEVGTLAALKAHRREIVDPAIAAHRGRIVKTAGDGMLVEFASAVDAVTGAMLLALSIDDGDPDTLAQAGFTLAYMVGDCERAIEIADRAVAVNPNSFLAWDGRGWAYRVAGLPKEALPSFERAIRISPVDPLLHHPLTGMGYAFIELGRFDEAIVAGKKAQRQNSSFPPAYRCLAGAFAHLGRDAEAHEAAERLLEVDPDFTISAWIARGGQSNAELMIEGLRKAGLPE